MADKKNEFEKSSILLLILSLIGSGCNYIYQIVMGNLLSTADFGTLNSLLTLSLVLGIPFGILNIVAVRFSAKYSAENEMDKLTHLMQSISKVAVCCSLTFLVIGIVFSQSIGNYLNINNRGFIIGAVFIASFACITPVVAGFVQGLKKFMAYGVYTIITIVFKLVLGVLFTVLGFGLLGNLAAVYLGLVAAALFCLYCIKDIFFKKCPKAIRIDFSDISKYVVLVFFAQMISALLINGDILLVKAYAATAEEVGIYSSAMVIAKIPFYLSGAFVTALFPMVAERAAQGKSTKSLFLKAIAYGGGITVASAIGLVLFGKFFIAILFGERYSDAIKLLLPASCLAVAISLITILMNYLLACGKTVFFTASLVVGLVCLLILVNFHHETVTQIVYLMASTLALVFVVNFIEIIRKE